MNIPLPTKPIVAAAVVAEEVVIDHLIYRPDENIWVVGANNLPFQIVVREADADFGAFPKPDLAAISKAISDRVLAASDEITKTP